MWRDFYSSPLRPDQLVGTPSRLSTGTMMLSSGVKRPGREAKHSPAFSAGVNNERSKPPRLYFLCVVLSYAPGTTLSLAGQLSKVSTYKVDDWGLILCSDFSLLHEVHIDSL
jgi:hypothetical protein